MNFPRQKQKFDIGDRLRVTGDGLEYLSKNVFSREYERVLGEEVEVVGYGEGGPYDILVKYKDGRIEPWNESWWEKCPD